MCSLICIFVVPFTVCGWALCTLVSIVMGDNTHAHGKWAFNNHQHLLAMKAYYRENEQQWANQVSSLSSLQWVFNSVYVLKGSECALDWLDSIRAVVWETTLSFEHIWGTNVWIDSLMSLGLQSVWSPVGHVWTARDVSFSLVIAALFRHQILSNSVISGWV